jgi:hypothetical protein
VWEVYSKTRQKKNGGPWTAVICFLLHRGVPTALDAANAAAWRVASLSGIRRHRHARDYRRQ